MSSLCTKMLKKVEWLFYAKHQARAPTNYPDLAVLLSFLWKYLCFDARLYIHEYKDLCKWNSPYYVHVSSLHESKYAGRDTHTHWQRVYFIEISVCMVIEHYFCGNESCCFYLYMYIKLTIHHTLIFRWLSHLRVR